MFIGSSQSALRPRSQSAFDLSLAQSHRNEGESQFSQEYDWLYGQNTALVDSEDAKETAQDNEEIAVSHSTECFFFHQFIAIHQESPNLVRSDSVFNDQISKINTYLSSLTDKQAAANESSETDPSI